MLQMTPEQKVHKQYAFEAFCKTLLKNKARNLHAKQNRIEDREIVLSNLSSDAELPAVHEDTYSLDDPTVFEIRGQQVLVMDESLAQGIRSLLPKYRDVLLLSFYTDYSDTEIGHILGLPISSVGPRRKAALRRLRERMSVPDER